MWINVDILLIMWIKTTCFVDNVEKSVEGLYYGLLNVNKFVEKKNRA